jgi:hypothetical protein
MQKLIGFGLSVLVNALLVIALAWSSPSRVAIPHGEVFITELNGAPTRMMVASHQMNR